MIEVEKKFLLTKKDEERLINGATFIGEKVFTDTYYDNVNYFLTSKDNWLRQRAGKFELKLSLNKEAGKKANFYNELEYESKIREYLGILGEESTEDWLLRNGYSKFCICKTTRRKYEKDGFGIDIDFVEYGDFNYEIAEIELMVESESKMDEALEKIMNFAKQNGLKIGYVRGKVLVYLKEKKPEHFQALLESGIAHE